jgi:hypothetical protein
MKKIERLIQTISPGWALERAVQKHDLMTVQNWRSSGYTSGNTDSRQRGHAAFGRSISASEEAVATEYGFDAMRLEAMDLYRNNPVARAVVETVRRYGRQSHPRACTASYFEAAGADKAQIDQAKLWDRQATEYFNDFWWPRSDALKRPGVTFGTMQDMFITLQFTQGDMAFVWNGDGFLVVEGMQIRTPQKLRQEKNVKHGFRFNAKGKMTHIYVCGYDKYGNISNKEFTRYPINSVIFCPWYWRPAQTRGVPRFHGVIDALRDDEEIHDATKMKVKHEAMLLSIERAGSRKAAPGSKLTNADGSETTVEKSDYGMRFRTSGKPGEDFQLAKGDSPNAQYVPLMEHDAKRISAGTGIPYKVLMSLYDGSWSSNKAAQVALKVFVDEIWTHRRDVFCQRAYNVIMAQAVRGGFLPPAPVNERGISLFNKAEWTRPYFPQLDQSKEEHGRSASFMNMTSGFDDWADEQGTTADALYLNHKKSIQRLKADAEDVGVPFELYAGGLLAKSTAINAVAEDKTDEI